MTTTTQLGAACAVALLLLLGGCASSSETANRDSMTAHVGVYSPPPAGAQRVRVGVPAFKVTDRETAAEAGQLAADQLVTLAMNTDRFDCIERTQLDQLLAEQSLEGIVQSGELAQPAKVRGVDYLLLGKVTNLRVKAEQSSSGFNLGALPIPGTYGGVVRGFDINNSESVIKVDCGVDLRLVDPTTGTTLAAQFGEYQRADTIGSFGVAILGSGANAGGTLSVDADSQGKILRLALDECLRKMLPKVDRELAAKAKASGATPPAEAMPAAPGAPNPAAKFCSQCGKPVAADAKFCAGCGAATK